MARASFRRSSAPVGLALALVVACAAPARADDPQAARAAYDRGAAAFTAKRYAEAAAELARADALAPNPVALASALKAAELADDPALAMTLADRAELRPGADEATLAAVKRVREKLGGRAGKLSVRCAAARGCSVTVDAEPFPIEQPRWVKAGAHAVEIATGAHVARYTVTVEGGRTASWQEPGAASPEPPKPEPPNVGAQMVGAQTIGAQTIEARSVEARSVEPSPRGGISPAWFWASLGVTAVAGGLSIWSGVDTLDKHAAFVARETDDPSSGKEAQTRTNVLFVVTGAAAIATAAVGIFAVRWSRPSVATGAERIAMRRRASRSSPSAPAAIAVGPLGVTLRGLF